jgi:SynChlorMet cassette radical SAM/SPASM protein ScmF
MSSIQRFQAGTAVSCFEEGREGALLYRPDTDETVVLNRTGRIIWSFLKTPHTLEEITGHIVATYPKVPSEQARQDVTRLVESLAPDIIAPATGDRRPTTGGRRTTDDGRRTTDDGRVPPLRAFYLYLSNGCNLHCRHCWITPKLVNGEPSPGDMIDFEALHKAVVEAKSLGLRSAKLTGGEPMLHPRFVAIADMLTTEGLTMDLETNGTLITEEAARHLKEKTKLSFISVSLDGPDAASHDAFRRKAGAFDAALRGLDHLVNAGYRNCQVIMSVHLGNLHQIEAVVSLAAKHGAASVKLNPVTRTGRGAAMHERGEALAFADYFALADRLTTELRPNAPINIVLNLPPGLAALGDLVRTQGRTGDCGVLGVLGILGTGEIALCGIGQTYPELVYGRLGETSIRDIWLSHPTILALRRDLKNPDALPGICARCVFARSCRTGCVADNYVHTGRLVAPNWLCAEADRQGSFPSVRAQRRRDAKAATRVKAGWIPAESKGDKI